MGSNCWHRCMMFIRSEILFRSSVARKGLRHSLERREAVGLWPQGPWQLCQPPQIQSFEVRWIEWGGDWSRCHWEAEMAGRLKSGWQGAGVFLLLSEFVLNGVWCASVWAHILYVRLSRLHHCGKRQYLLKSCVLSEGVPWSNVLEHQSTFKL